MINILIVVFIISFLVIAHELGHYIAAKKTGINVQEFGFGYPPRVFKLFSYKGTQFSLNAIPFGGFVRLEGEMGKENDLEEEHEILIDKTKLTNNSLTTGGPFYSKSVWQRSQVVLAGVVTNALFAVIAFSFVFSFIGIPTDITDQARIGVVVDNSPAAEVQLPTNSSIIEVRSETQVYKISGIKDVQAVVSNHRGSSLTFVVTGSCDGINCQQEYSEYEIYARTAEETPADQGSIGVIFDEMVLQFYPWYEMPFRGTWYGIKQAIGLSWMILVALVDMITNLFIKGAIPQDLAGPVGIVDEAYQGRIISSNFWSNLGFAGMLSLNLAIMNLLPIPALDGGKFLFIMLEKIMGKKRVEKIESYANFGGFALIILLIIAITINDVGKIVSR